MNQKLSPILLKYESMEIRLSQPETVSDPQLYTALIKEYNSLTPLIEVYRGYLATQAELTDAEELASDPDCFLAYRTSYHEHGLDEYKPCI